MNKQQLYFRELQNMFVSFVAKWRSIGLNTAAQHFSERSPDYYIGFSEACEEITEDFVGLLKSYNAKVSASNEVDLDIVATRIVAEIEVRRYIARIAEQASTTPLRYLGIKTAQFGTRLLDVELPADGGLFLVTLHRVCP